MIIAGQLINHGTNLRRVNMSEATMINNDLNTQNINLQETDPEMAVIINNEELGDTPENRKSVNKTGLMYTIGIAIFAGCQMGLSYIISKFFADFAANYSQLITMLVVLLTDVCLLIPMMFLLTKNISVVKAKPAKLKASTFTVTIFICYFAMIVGSLLGNGLNSVITGNSQNMLVQSFGGGNTLVMFLVVGLLGPIAEELVFRKFLIDRISRFGNGFAILVSALFFGLFHMNLQQFFYAFFLGLIFGFTYVKTRNIKYSIIYHAIINTYSSVILMWALKGMSTSPVKTMIFSVATVIEILAAIVGGVLFFVFLNKIKVKETASHPGKASFAFAGWGMWPFYIVSIVLLVVITMKVF